MDNTTQAQSVIDALAQKGYAQTTDLGNEFSYGNGVKNITGMQNSGRTLSLRATNNTPANVLFAIVPTAFKNLSNSKNPATIEGNVIVFYDAAKPSVSPGTAFFVESLDSDQDLTEIASELAFSPTFISKINFQSYNSTTGAPENTNFRNIVKHVFRSAWLADSPGQKMELAKFQSKNDQQLSMAEVDFIKEAFPSLVSYNDAIIFQVNAGTTLNLLCTIGARDSRSEYFQRQVTAGVRMLNQYSAK